VRGLVIKNTGSWYQVKTEDGKLVDCKIKGNFRLKGIRSTNPIAVGDYVQIIVNNEGTAFMGTDAFFGPDSTPEECVAAITKLIEAKNK
jgi:translation initiation factor IF-1